MNDARGSAWQEEFETPEELYARFKNVDPLRGRQANELGRLHRQIGLYEHTCACSWPLGIHAPRRG